MSRVLLVLLLAGVCFSEVLFAQQPDENVALPQITGADSFFFVTNNGVNGTIGVSSCTNVTLNAWPDARTYNLFVSYQLYQVNAPSVGIYHTLKLYCPGLPAAYFIYQFFEIYEGTLTNGTAIKNAGAIGNSGIFAFNPQGVCGTPSILSFCSTNSGFFNPGIGIVANVIYFIRATYSNSNSPMMAQQKVNPFPVTTTATTGPTTGPVTTGATTGPTTSDVKGSGWLFGW